MEREATFHIGPVPVYGDVILAPMAGFADVPHRALCRAYGSALSYTEFVAVEEIIKGLPQALALLDFRPEDRPICFQIFGNEPQLFLEAAQRLEALEPDVIDINMGCSTRRVSGRGAGVGMMPQPELVRETFALLTRHLTVPVTGKIRLGWDDKQNYLEIARIMEGEGAAMVAIHPRTKEQRYRGQAKWQAITEVKSEVAIPVLGNGDVRTPADIDCMLDQTGCDAVLIGRGAIGNPWIFARRAKADLPFAEIAAGIRVHLQAMIDYHGEYGLILFRKHLKRYIKDWPGAKPFYLEMVVAEDVPTFEAHLCAAERSLAAVSGGPVTVAG